jgi:hypothetical protein
MRCGDFGSVLRTFGNVLDTAGAPVARDQIMAFAVIFDADPTLNVSDLVKRIASLPRSANAGRPNLDDVARLLSALKDLLNETAKKPILTDVNSVEKLLRDRALMEISAFVHVATEAATARRPTGKPVREDLVAHYKQNLETSLRDEEKFTTIYNDLRANTAIGKPEMVALAKQMTGTGARTRDAALQKIWKRHRSLMTLKAKSRATGGRSAA